MRGELAARWILGPTPGSQTVLATRTDMERAVMVEAQGTGLLDAWPFTSVATGFSHTCGIDGDGTAYCWGRGDIHRLGTGETVSVSAPVPVASALSWTRISAGLTHSCALGGPGAQIHCWGQGLQTGQGGNQIVPTPLPVPGGPWGSLAAGDAHQCAVATNGAGYCWGEGQYGRLGTGSSTSTGDPSFISGGRAWTQLSAGRFHTCGVTTSGQAYCWGRGAEGQLGSGTTQEALTPVLVAGGFQWQSVSAGWAHSCGTTVDGDAFCWGEGSSNELGNGSAVDQTSPVKVAGNRAWRAVTSDARTFCWGINDYGQLGIRTTTSSNILRLVFRGVIRP